MLAAPPGGLAAGFAASAAMLAALLGLVGKCKQALADAGDWFQMPGAVRGGAAARVAPRHRA